MSSARGISKPLPDGVGKIAALGIVMKVTMIVVLILVGFSFGGVPLFGFLYGSKNRDKFRKLLRFCTGFLCGIAAVESFAVFLFAGPLMGIFIDDPDIIADGALMMRWQVAGMVFAAIVLLYTCVFQASVKPIPALAMSLSRQGLLFIAVFLIATAVAGYTGFLVSQPVPFPHDRKTKGEKVDELQDLYKSTPSAFTRKTI